MSEKGLTHGEALWLRPEFKGRVVQEHCLQEHIGLELAPLFLVRVSGLDGPPQPCGQHVAEGFYSRTRGFVFVFSYSKKCYEILLSHTLLSSSLEIHCHVQSKRSQS